jgi:hypothetical protein
MTGTPLRTLRRVAPVAAGLLSAVPLAAFGVLESVAGTSPGQPLWATGAGPTIETTTG